jgi:uncharacterized protein
VKPGKVEFYKSRTGWRWRIVARNGRKLANCGQGYSRRCDCVRDFDMVTRAGDWRRVGLRLDVSFRNDT